VVVIDRVGFEDFAVFREFAVAHVDMDPKLVGRAIGMTLSPLPANKRHRKFSKHGEILEPEPVDHDHGDDEDAGDE